MKGVAVACAIKAAIQKFNISATVVLLGTPGQLYIPPHHITLLYRPLPSAEESGGGKLLLLDAGAYKEMDACLM